MATTDLDSSRQIAIDETVELIASDKVEGTEVFSRQGDDLGSIYNFMVNKRTGQVEYAVLSFGGFLGLGESFYPLPWNSLTYDTTRGGYVVDLDQSKIEKAPSYQSGSEPSFDRAYRKQLHDYWGEPL